MCVLERDLGGHSVSSSRGSSSVKSGKRRNIEI